MEKKLYLTIRDYIIDLIKENEDTPEFRLPSENQLVQKFNASRYSVRHALKLLEDKNIILRHQGKGAFVNPNKEAFDLDMDTKYIEIIVPQLLSRHANEIILGAQKFCSDFQYRLNIQTANDNKKEEDRFLREIPHNCQGIILFPVDRNQISKELLSISLSSFPLVLVDRYIPNLKMNYVCTDNHKMLYNAVQKLHETGFKSPCFLTVLESTTTSVAERNQGFYQGMIQFYGKIEKHNLILNHAYSDDITTPLQNYLSEKKIDCIIMNDGPLSVKFFALCNKLNVKIGKDITLILIDEETTLPNLDFPYGKITQQSFEIGYRAAEILHKKIHNKKAPAETVRLSAINEF